MHKGGWAPRAEERWSGWAVWTGGPGRWTERAYRRLKKQLLRRHKGRMMVTQQQRYSQKGQAREIQARVTENYDHFTRKSYECQCTWPFRRYKGLVYVTATKTCTKR